jgi:hypothetical protein
MRTFASLAATTILLCAPLGMALAQNAPDQAAPAAPATTAAPPAAPAAQTPPADAPAAPTQSNNAPSSSPSAKTATDATPDTKANKTKKKKTGMTRRQEIDKSIDTGTVPSRYRSSVPKEYQHYIPFSRD